MNPLTTDCLKASVLRAARAGLLVLAAGCGTTRMTDTSRTGTEQLLISNAVDQAVSRLDFHRLAGQPVFLDPQYLDNTVDKGYVVSSLRQDLLASGCLLQEDRAKATYVIEARAGGVGTDNNSLLVGIPQTTVPTPIPGQSATIPELPLAKKAEQTGVAKIAVFAYNRKTGEPVFQSGVVQAVSTSKEVWVLGAGPFQNGPVRDRVTFAGDPLPSFSRSGADGKPAAGAIPVTAAASFAETGRAAAAPPPAAKDTPKDSGKDSAANALTSKPPASPPLAGGTTPAAVAKADAATAKPSSGATTVDGTVPLPSVSVKTTTGSTASDNGGKSAGSKSTATQHAGGSNDPGPGRAILSVLNTTPGP
jgi:hypothetical protein